AGTHPLRLVPALCTTGGRRLCGSPSLASRRSTRPNDRSISRGCSSLSSARSCALVGMSALLLSPAMIARLVPFARDIGTRLGPAPSLCLHFGPLRGRKFPRQCL